MSIKSFKGGVHPPERKAVLSSDDVVRVLPSNKSVWIPVTQGGMPNTPLVNVGDLVARGQKIAETDKFMSAPVHSSVSGKVKKIEPHLVTGNTGLSLIFSWTHSYSTWHVNVSVRASITYIRWLKKQFVYKTLT